MRLRMRLRHETGIANEIKDETETDIETKTETDTENENKTMLHFDVKIKRFS